MTPKINMFAVALWTLFSSFLNMNMSDASESKSTSFKPLNIVVILDTSDRVSEKKYPGQLERDIKIVEEIINQFKVGVKEHIDQGNELKYDSRLEIVIPNQPTIPTIPWEITEKLTIKDEGEAKSVSGIYNDLDDQGKALLEAMPKLYEFVKKHKQTGSDIWKWFQSHAKDYLPTDSQNVIICISDGYLDFDKNIEAARSKGTYMRVEELRKYQDWRQKIRNGEGLLPIGKDFSGCDVKFLMLEIVLRHEKNSGAPYQKDFDIIREYWKTWLESMGIESTDFVERGPHPGRKIESYFE